MKYENKYPAKDLIFLIISQSKYIEIRSRVSNEFIKYEIRGIRTLITN